VANFSFHTNSFDGAGIDTDAAIYAGVETYDSFAVSHLNGFAGALGDAALTAGAFFFVNFSWHYITLSKKTN
jgi:hypothetical protein